MKTFALQQRTKSASPKTVQSPVPATMHCDAEAMRDLLKSGTIQARLRVGSSSDPAEQQADRMAATITGDGALPRRGTEADSLQLGSSARSSLQMQFGGGRSLDSTEQGYFGARFGQDFGDVRIHEGSRAAQAASAINARAFTYGSHVFMGAGEYNRGSVSGNQLLAHELTHTIQNRTAPSETVQRWSLELPFVEKILIGVTDAASVFVGREMTAAEIALAKTVYGDRIDYSQVRIIQSDALCWRAVGNNVITAEADDLLSTSYNRKTLIHELGHVWQYQHFGSSYISKSLFDQAVAAIKTGDRNNAYTYTVEPGKRFLDYGVEQQASMIENYFHARWVVTENKNATAIDRTAAQAEMNELEPLIKEMLSVLTPSQRTELKKETAKANK